MKKLKTLFLLGSMILAFTGCKGLPENIDDEKNVDEVKTQAEETEEEEEITETFRPEIDSQIEYLFDSCYEDGLYGNPYLNGWYDSYYLSTETKEKYPALATVFEEKCQERDAKYDELHNQFLEQSKSMRQNGEDVIFSIKSDLCLRRSDERVVSFVDQATEYAGGAHGFTDYTSYNFDVQNGKEIKLGDIVTDENAFRKELAMNLTDQYGEESIGIVENTLTEMSLDEYQWTFGPHGITFYFSNDIASYATGVLTATLPYDYSFFTQEYAIRHNKGYISELPIFISDTEHVDSILTADGITFEPNYDSEGYEMGIIDSLTIRKDGQELNIPELYIFDADAYLMCTADDKEFLFLIVSGESDWHTSYIIALDDGLKVVSQDYYSIGAAVDEEIGRDVVPSDPENIALSSHFDLLCTFCGTRSYSLGKDGKLRPLDDYFYAQLSPELDLVSKVELTVPVVDDKGEETGEKAILPEGTHYHLIRTNGQDVDCTVEDGKIIRIKLEKASDDGYVGDLEIDGVNAYDIFETLWYAG